MKKIIISLSILLFLTLSLSAQKNNYSEKYGGSLNLGIGIGGYSGYYGYAGSSLPVFNINYEFDAAKNFTLAPFLTYYSYSNSYYWGDHNNPYKYYNYHETVIPIGVKGTYYLDQLFKANSSWDFYLAGSLGFAIVSSSWDSGYNGDVNYYHHPNTLFLDIHIGTEYHLSSKIGIFLDISSGVSTIGLAIH